MKIPLPGEQGLEGVLIAWPQRRKGGGAGQRSVPPGVGTQSPDRGPRDCVKIAQTDKEPSSTVHPQMPATGGTGLGQSQEPGVQFLEPSLAASRMGIGTSWDQKQTGTRNSGLQRPPVGGAHGPGLLPPQRPPLLQAVPRETQCRGLLLRMPGHARLRAHLLAHTSLLSLVGDRPAALPTASRTQAWPPPSTPRLPEGSCAVSITSGVPVWPLGPLLGTVGVRLCVDACAGARSGAGPRCLRQHSEVQLWGDAEVSGVGNHVLAV